MMKRLIVVCEGPTEKEFCRDLLITHFLKRDIMIEARRLHRRCVLQRR